MPTPLIQSFKVTHFTNTIPMASKTLTNKLESMRLLIFNSKDPQVAPLLETMGIDTTYIDKGEALYNEVTRLVDDQKERIPGTEPCV